MLSVVIQAGGQSKRMGQDKALVPLRGKPLINHVLDRVSGLGDEVLITTNSPDDFSFLDLPTVQDKSPGAGALAGLATALNGARGEHVLIVACDLPFLQQPLLRYLIELTPKADVIVPEWNGELEPLVAVYARKCLTEVDHSLSQGEMRMVSFFPRVKVHRVFQHEIMALDPGGLSFFNVNTPEDLATAERILDPQDGK
jgi:molybdenum cofactor guanylyltransferase